MVRSAVVVVAVVAGWMSVSSPAWAQALRRFEGAHESNGGGSSGGGGGSGSGSGGSSSSGSSSSGSGSSGSESSGSGDSGGSSSNEGAAILLEATVRAVVVIADAIGDAVSDPRPHTVEASAKSFPAAEPYRSSEDDAYTRPWRLDRDGAWVHDGAAPRRGELALNGFLAMNERVYAHDVALRGWLGLFVAQGSWERFYEPRRDLGTVDTLDMFRVHMGPNILGPHVHPIELYVLFGGAAMHGPSSHVIPAFDVAFEGRAYPLAPLAFYASTTASFFAEGPPLFDARLEAGVAVWRFDLRAGLRGLKQEPEQSFFGPVASLSMRL